MRRLRETVKGHGATMALLGLVAAGCARPAHLASGPIELSAVPVLVRFEEPVVCTGPSWELWFEFELPGDSDHADSIQVELVSATEQRYGLAEAELDRRGEALVSLTGTLVAREDGAPPVSGGVTFTAVELSADRPLGLRALRGGRLE